MPENFNQLASKTTMFNVLESLKDNINYNINCIKAATVVSFDSTNLTVCCKVNNKRMMGLLPDGNQQLQDYPLIYAKAHFFGWGDVGATFPITEGMEGFLLFNDRELETWFTTGTTGNLAYDRAHDLSDAIFICGIHSIPHMISIAENCLNIFYKTKNIQINKNGIIVNGDLKVNGSITATGDIVANGISLLNHVHGNGNQGQNTTKAK